MDVFGQILHFTPLFMADLDEILVCKYAIQLKHNGIKHILNKFQLGFK
jgi:hypothetical protein